MWSPRSAIAGISGAAGPRLPLFFPSRFFFLEVFPAAFALWRITTQTITYDGGGCLVTVSQMARLSTASNKILSVTLLPVYFEQPSWLRAQMYCGGQLRDKTHTYTHAYFLLCALLISWITSVFRTVSSATLGKHCCVVNLTWPSSL